MGFSVAIVGFMLTTGTTTTTTMGMIISIIEVITMPVPDGRME